MMGWTATGKEACVPKDLDFVYPWRLWLLIGVGLIAAAFVVTAVRRRSAGSAYADPSLLGAVAPRRPGWRRAPGQVLVLLAMVAMTVAWAEPEALADNARDKSLVVVALDVSGSMKNTDIAPTRFAAALEAVQTFVDRLPKQVDISLVTFAGTAALTVAPTSDHSAVTRVLPTLTTSPGTSQGDAILTALSAITSALPHVDPGGVPAARIVLLSDGSSPDGTPVPVAVSKAKELHVPVSTIALGTDVTGAFDGSELAQTAKDTGGIAYTATDADSLDGVYADIGSQVEKDTKREPLSAPVMGIGLALLVAGVVPTVLFLGRVP